MTKSGRAKREKKKDFIKKKIKVGKTLKKPQNETITTFKSRSINIIEQLVEKELGANVTRKRYTMTDLCCRLSHSSVNHKLDACSGVRELLGKLEADQVRESISFLVTALAPCLVNDDCKLRTTAIKLVEMLIEKVGCVSITPHFSLFGRHLSCGLVSLHSDVQASSLHMLRMMLHRAPSLLHLHANTIVPNLLRMLGTKTKSGVMLQKVFMQGVHGIALQPSNKKSTMTSTKGKTHNTLKKKDGDSLVVKAREVSKHNSLLWQLDILVLLTAVLRQVLKYNGTTTGINDNNWDGFASSATQNNGSAWQVLLQGVHPNFSNSSLCVYGDGVAENTRFALLCNAKKLQSFCAAMLPLLHSLWRNLLPENAVLKSGVTMSNSSSHCLWCLVELHSILSAMVEACTSTQSSQCPWFSDLVRSVYSDILHNHFPFHYAEEPLIGNKLKKNYCKYDDRPTASSDDLNIRLATVGVNGRLFLAKHHYTLMHYMLELLSEDKIGTFDMQAACQLILGLVDVFVPQSRGGHCNLQGKHKQQQGKSHQLVSTTLSDGEIAVNKLLAAALGCYQRLHPLKKERRHLLALLLRVTDVNHRHLHCMVALQAWCQYLVDDMCSGSVLPSSLVEAAVQLLLRRCPGMIPSLDQRTVLARNIQVHGVDINEDEKANLIRLFSK